MRRTDIAVCAAVLMLAGVAQAQSLGEAQAHVDRQDFAAAQTTLEARLAVAPEDEAARFLLARVLAWKGEPEAAIPLFERLLARSPTNADYLLGLGQAQLWAGRTDAAIATLERAATLAPGYADVQTALEQARKRRLPSTSAPGDEASEQAAPASPPGPSNADPHANREAIASGPDAPEANEARRSVSLSHRRDWLDRGYADWKSNRLDVSDRGADRRSLYGALVHERRFGLVDRGVELGASLPVGRWSIQPEIGLVEHAEFLPRRSLALRAERPFGNGWVGAAAVRRSEYREERVERVSIGAERYAGPWRASYTLNVTRIGSSEAAGHDLRIARAYGDGSEMGVQFVAGREDATLGTRIVESEARGVSIGGRHAFTPGWLLLWNAGVVEQGALYTRRGLMLGLERRF